jgi:hypothetical protein
MPVDESRIDALLEQLTLEEQAALLAGAYEVRVGASSQAIHGSATFTLRAERAEPTRTGLLAAM